MSLERKERHIRPLLHAFGAAEEAVVRPDDAQRPAIGPGELVDAGIRHVRDAQPVRLRRHLECGVVDAHALAAAKLERRAQISGRGANSITPPAQHFAAIAQAASLRALAYRHRRRSGHDPEDQIRLRGAESRPQRTRHNQHAAACGERFETGERALRTPAVLEGELGHWTWRRMRTKQKLAFLGRSQREIGPGRPGCQREHAHQNPYDASRRPSMVHRRNLAISGRRVSSSSFGVIGPMCL